jgi:hypothetical protein
MYRKRISNTDRPQLKDFAHRPVRFPVRWLLLNDETALCKNILHGKIFAFQRTAKFNKGIESGIGKR